MRDKDLIKSEDGVYSKFKYYLKSFFYLGVTESKLDFQNSRTLIINLISIISIVFLFAAFIILGFADGFVKNSWLLLFIPHLFYILYLNDKKQFKKAKVLFLSSNILSIGVISLIIRGVGVEYNLIITICLAPFLFGKTRLLLFYVVGSVLVFIAVHYFPSLIFSIENQYIDHQDLTSKLSLGFAIVTALFLVIAFQRMSANFSQALIENKKIVEQKLDVSKQESRSLFANMMEAYAYCKIVFENNKPIDFIHLEVNEAFKNHTGIANPIGKKMTELIPGIKETNPHLFEVMGRVVLSKKPERFEVYIAGLIFPPTLPIRDISLPYLI